jgi:hypothetical protein
MQFDHSVSFISPKPEYKHGIQRDARECESKSLSDCRIGISLNTYSIETYGKKNSTANGEVISFYRSAEGGIGLRRTALQVSFIQT